MQKTIASVASRIRRDLRLRPDWARAAAADARPDPAEGQRRQGEREVASSVNLTPPI